MGEMHPMFVRAGMTAYPQPPSPQSERLRGRDWRPRASAGPTGEAPTHAGGGLDGGSSRRPATPTPRSSDGPRSYLGAKNHRTNRPDRRRMMELVAKHLDTRPVYYLWRRPPSGEAKLAGFRGRHNGIQPQRNRRGRRDGLSYNNSQAGPFLYKSFLCVLLRPLRLNPLLLRHGGKESL